MQSSPLEISVLAAGTTGAGMGRVPHPRARWKTRVVLPFAILAAAGGLLAYAARGALMPAVEVWVVPVVGKPYETRGSVNSPPARAVSPVVKGSLLVQAPGWVEAAPYAINVPALAEGVIAEVLVLEGDRVESSQIIARMVDDDARLSVRAAKAELAALLAQISKAEFDLEVAQAEAAEVGDRLARARELVSTGGIPQGEFARLEYRFKAAEKETDSARAAIEVAKANAQRQTVAVDEAKLRLSRMEIRSPVSGVVMSRLVEPGTRMSMASRTGTEGAASEAMSGTVARLYDPAKLQVRAEIPLSDSAKIERGCLAEITTEALPDETLHGTVTRIVHEANIQRNTIQVKISIDDPVAALKPEMLARVRLYAAPTTSPTSDEPASAPALTDHPDANNLRNKIAQPGLRLIIPVSVLVNRESDSADVWVVRKMEGGENIAERRNVSLATVDAGGVIEVLDGVRLGDRLIADPPPGLSDGTRVRIVGEKMGETAEER